MLKVLYSLCLSRESLFIKVAKMCTGNGFSTHFTDSSELLTPREHEMRTEKLESGNLIAPLGGLPSRVPQILIDLVCLFVCLWRDLRIFTEWYLRRSRTQIPFGLLKQGPKRGPALQTFKDGVRRKLGPKILRLFFQKKFDKKPIE